MPHCGFYRWVSLPAIITGKPLSSYAIVLDSRNFCELATEWAKVATGVTFVGFMAANASDVHYISFLSSLALDAV